MPRPITNRTMLWGMRGCRLNAECGVRNAERLRSVILRSQGKFFNAECKVQNAECRMGFTSFHSVHMVLLKFDRLWSLDAVRGKKFSTRGVY